MMMLTLRTHDREKIPPAFSAVTQISPACFSVVFSKLNVCLPFSTFNVMFSLTPCSIIFSLSFHSTVGVGCPVISQLNVASSPSLTKTESGPEKKTNKSKVNCCADIWRGISLQQV